MDIFSSDNEDDFFNAIKAWVVNDEKYKTLMKTNDDIEEIFKSFLIQHNKKERSFLIGLYKKIPRLNVIQLIINKVLIMENHAPWHETAEMIFKTMNYYWTNMYRDNEEYVKQSYECQTHQNHKKKQRVVKHIWTARWFQRY